MKMKQVRKYVNKHSSKAVVSKYSKSVKLSCGHLVHTSVNPWNMFCIGETVVCDKCLFNEVASRPKPIRRYNCK